MSDPSTTHAVDIQGCLRLRLVDPPASAILDLQRRLPTTPAGDADLPTLDVRFIDELPRAGTVRPVGGGGHAIIDGGLVLGRGPAVDRPRSILRFDAIPPSVRRDGEPALLCERAVGRVPHLIPLVNIALLGLGVLPLHASSVVMGGSGIALAGWRKSGKTEAMLALTSAGGALLADEWTYVRPDQTISGMPGPIRVPVDIVRQLDLPMSVTGQLAWPKSASAIARLIGHTSGARRGRASRAIGRVGDRLRERAVIDIPAAQLVGSDRIVPAAPLAMVVFLRPTLGAGARLEDAEPGWVAARMAAAHAHHRLDLVDLYGLSQFAAPEVAHPVLDDVAGYERAATARAFNAVPCFVLEHPIPFDIAAIREALWPMLIERGLQGAS